MEIIRAALPVWDAALPTLRIGVDRLTLAKRRWRGVAEDGREFGFDLDAPLADGAHVFQRESAVYFIAQKYEPVLELRIADWLAPHPTPASPLLLLGGLRIATDAARLGWVIGNLHFPLEVTAEAIRVADDPALRQLFARESLPFTACKRVFHPLSGGHRH